MSDRLPTALLLTAMLRRVHDAGGAATVLAKGDADGGMILVIAMEKGRNLGLLERGIDGDGRAALVPVGPLNGDEVAVGDYWQRRRARDPDLWVVELDIPFAERFAAETILAD